MIDFNSIPTAKLDYDSIQPIDNTVEELPPLDINTKEPKPTKYENYYAEAFKSGRGLSEIVPLGLSNYRNNLSGKEYEDLESGVINSLYLSDITGLSYDTVKYPNVQKEITRVLGLSDDELEKEQPDQKKLSTKIAERYNNGRIQVKQMDALYQASIGNMSDDEAIALSEELEGKIKGDPYYDFRKLYERMAGGTAEQVPMMLEGIKASPKGALAGGVVGLAMALVLGETVGISAPEEVVTIPSFTLKGMKIGGGISAANRMRELETGGSYLELLKMTDDKGNKIDPKIAKVIAHTVGTINGGIELAEWATVLSTFGVGTKVFEKVADKVSQKLFAEGTLKQIASKYMIKYGTSLTAETLQEVAQESTTIIGDELSKAINNSLKESNFKPEKIAEINKRLKQTIQQSAESFALLLAPGTMLSGAIEVMPKKVKAKEYINTDLKDTIEIKDETISLDEEVKDTGNDKKTTQIATDVIKTDSKTNVVDISKDATQVNVDVSTANVEETQELTTQDIADIAQLDVEMEKDNLYEMKRVNIGTEENPVDNFVIYEKSTGKEVEVINKRDKAKDKLNELNKLEEPVRETSRIPALLKKPIGKLVSEYSALKSGLKKAAADARKAFSEGKAEGIAKIKQQYKELKAKIAEKKMLQDRIDKALKVIKKPFESKKIDFYYREAIETIQSGIDPKNRSNKTILSREATKEFLGRATSEQLRDMPVKLLETLNKKTLNDMSIEDLESVADNIKTLKKLGETKQKARMAIAKANKEKNIKELISVSNVSTESIEDAIGSVKVKKWQSTNKQKATGFISWFWNMPRILDFMDGMKGKFSGKWYSVFYDNVNTAYNTVLKMTDKRKSTLDAIQKSLDITDAELVSEIDFSEVQDGLSLTIEQMMGIYAGAKNQLSLDAIVNGCKVTTEAINIIVSNLEDKYKQFSDAIIDEYQSNYSRLRDAFIDDKGEDMGTEKFYTPIIRLEKTGETLNEQLADQLLSRNGLKKGYIEKGFTIHRQNIAAEHQKPIDLRLVTVWRNQIKSQEHYINLSKPLKEINSILSDESIRTAIKLKGGPELLKTFEDYSSRMANPNFYKSFSAIEKWSQLFRKNLAIAYLAYNLVTMSRQAGALVLTIGDAGISNIVDAMGQYAAHPMDVSNFVMERDPQVKHRFLEREITELELKENERNDYEKIMGVVGRTGMAGISGIDLITRVISWKAIYDQGIKSGMSEEEAIRDAQQKILRTQEAGAPKDLARIYASNEFLNWFTMFTRQLNQIFGKVSYDIFAFWNDKNYKAAAYSMLAVSLNAALMWAITNKRLPEDEDDAKDMVISEVMSWAPLAGSYLSSGYQGFENSPPPAKIPLAIGKFMNAKDKEKAAIKIVEEVGALSGYPVVASKRLYRTIDQEDLSKLFGEKPKNKDKSLIP